MSESSKSQHKELEMSQAFPQTHKDLIEWGHWVRSGGLGLQYRSPMGILQLMCVGDTARTPNIDDDTACRIDAAVARLKIRNGDVFKVLVLTYISGMTQRQVAKELRLPSQATAARYIESGVSWVDSVLSNDVPKIVTFIA